MSAGVLPSGHNNSRSETHWTRWKKLMPFAHVHWYTNCAHQQVWTHMPTQISLYYKCLHATCIVMVKYMDGVQCKESNEVKWMGKIISRKMSLGCVSHTHKDRREYCEDSSCNLSRLSAAVFYNWFKHTEAITLIPSIMCDGNSNSPLVLSYIYSLMVCS